MNLFVFISQRLNRTDKGSFSSKVRIIATTTVAIGLAVMIVSFSVLEGFKAEIRNKIFSLGGHIQISYADTRESFEEIPVSTQSNIYTTATSIEGVKSIQSYLHKAALLQTDNEVQGIVIKGVGKDFDSTLFSQNLISGNFFSVSDTAVSREIVISKRVSESLKIKTNDSVWLYFIQKPPRIRKVKVCGIYDTGLDEFDNAMVMGDIDLVRQISMLGDTAVGGFEIFLNDHRRMDELYPLVFDAMDYNLQLDLITEKYPQIFDWLNLLDRNVYIFLVLILWVCCFNIVSSVFIMIMERMKMIGILKALGARNNQIRKIFLWNGLSILGKGILWGNAIALLFCFLQDKFKLIGLDRESYYMEFVPIHWDWFIIFALNLLTVVCIFLVLLIPIWIISYIKPVKSIRFN